MTDTPHASLAAALAAFQAELPKLLKDEMAKVKGETKDGRPYDRSYGYADLAQVVETVLPVLGKHGLSITSKSVIDPGSGFTLEVALLHEVGEKEIGYWPLPDPRRAGPQDIGSAMTYGRRYLTLALTGTYPGGEDDDGAQAQRASRDSWDDARPARPQADRQQAPQAAAAPPPPKTSWTDAEVADVLVRMPTAPVDQVIKVYDWMAGKKLHNREVVGAAADGKVTATVMVAHRLAAEALLPDAEVAEIAHLRNLAADRGLLKVQVSETETLEQALHEARDLAAHAAVEQAKAETRTAQDT